MRLDLCALNWQGLSSLISAAIALSTLLYAVISPRRREKRKEIENASLLRNNIRLYLDVLKDKLDRHLGETGGLTTFEGEAEQNHNALEDLSLHSQPLRYEERVKLYEFVRHYKSALPMQGAAFGVYRQKLSGLLELFPAMK